MTEQEESVETPVETKVESEENPGFESTEPEETETDFGAAEETDVRILPSAPKKS